MTRAKPATIDRFGRVLIPRKIRDLAGLRVGAEIEIGAERGGVLLATRESGTPLRRKKGVLVIAGTATGDIAEAAERSRDARLARLAGHK